MEQHPIENIMRSSMEHIKALADVNTVIGSPIRTDDDTLILPVSKVALGMLVGGGEYESPESGKKSRVETYREDKYPFIGASTLGMGLTPLAFLAVQQGSVRVLPAKQECPSDRLIDLIPRMLDTAERLIKELAGNEGSSEFRSCRRWSFTEKNHNDMKSEMKYSEKTDEDSRPFTGEQLHEEDL